jgi:hypothetical protein
MTPLKHHAQTGQRFGRGTVTDPEIRVPNGPGQTKRGCRLRCDCGTVYEAALTHLARGVVKSCGCLSREMTSARATTHGLTRDNTTGRHPLYNTWKAMMARCYRPHNPNYPRYGARGISVCPRWHDVTAFIEDIENLIGPRPEGMSLDRIRNGLGYKPSNVRWATASQQVTNRRRNGLSPQQRMERRRAVFGQWNPDRTQGPTRVAAALGMDIKTAQHDIEWIRTRIARLEAHRARQQEVIDHAQEA